MSMLHCNESIIPLNMLKGVVVIVWQLDLPFPLPSAFITTKVVSSNPVPDEVCSIPHYVIKLVCQCLAAGRQFSLGTLVSSTNKSDHHDITEILLKVTLNTTTVTQKLIMLVFCIMYFLCLFLFCYLVYTYKKNYFNSML